MRIAAPLFSPTSLPQLSQTSTVLRATVFPPSTANGQRQFKQIRNERGCGEHLLASVHSSDFDSSGEFGQRRPRFAPFVCRASRCPKKPRTPRTTITPTAINPYFSTASIDRASEVVGDQADRRRPEDSADRVVENESTPGHVADAGEPGHGDPKTRDEAADHDGLRPVALEEALAPRQQLRERVARDRDLRDHRSARPSARSSTRCCRRRSAASAATAITSTMLNRPPAARTPAAISAVSPGSGIPDDSTATSRKSRISP